MLPDLIEIKPLAGPVTASIAIPGSKSITNRALLLAALADGEVILRGALKSEDTVVMEGALRQLGIKVDPIVGGFTVTGNGGKIAKGPQSLNVLNAGTAARFLAALVCLGSGEYTLKGIARMNQRPQGPLFRALRQLGYQIDAKGDHLPAVVHGAGTRAGARCEIGAEESSQFASALLLCEKTGGWQVELKGEAGEDAAYIAMTKKMIGRFQEMNRDASGHAKLFPIEPDASSASYFVAANHLLTGSKIDIPNFPTSDWQIDAAFPKFLPLPETISRKRDLGDSIMTAIVLAPFAQRPTTFTELDRLRVQECERVAALRTELTKCGAKVEERGQTLAIHPSALHGAEIETYNDHRMAMCFAILGLKIGGVKIKNPACVKKTFPNFFQKLASSPPEGLGAVILDCGNGRPLSGAQLLAE